MTTSAPTVKIVLSDADPIAFGLFLHFVYQGHSPFAPTADRHFGPGSATLPKNTTSTAHISLIPPSIDSYVLGCVLRAPAFQHHALQYTHHNLGRTIFLTPQIVFWVYTYTSHNDALRRLILDVLISFWSKPTRHIVKSADLDEAWIEVFNAFPDMHRDFLFGLQGGKTQKAQRNLMETPKGTNFPPYARTPNLAAKGKEEQVGHTSNSDPSYIKVGDHARTDATRKNKVHDVVVKSEPGTTPLIKMPFGREHTSNMEPAHGRSNSPTLRTTAATPAQRRFVASPSSPIEQPQAKTSAVSNKRGASLVIAQGHPKLPKLSPQVDPTGDIVTGEEVTKERRATAKPDNDLQESITLKVDGKIQT
jgi:hypothetical protein